MPLMGLLESMLQPGSTDPAPLHTGQETRTTSQEGQTGVSPSRAYTDAGGHLGLWPAFSLMNHSCVPSAVNYVGGDVMAVHAARHIPKVRVPSSRS